MLAVDLNHVCLEFISMFKSDNSNVNIIKNIHTIVNDTSHLAIIDNININIHINKVLILMEFQY